MKQVKKAKVAIVLLSYNSLSLVKKFLPLIQKHSPDSPDYQIVLVDNASEDDTYSYVSEHFPDVGLIQLKVNKGFTNGYVESLAQIEAEYYVLISSDIEVSPNWCEPVINYMDQHPEVAICGPKIMSFDRKDEFEYAGAAGGFIDHLGYPFCRGRMFTEVEKDQGQYDNIQEVFWASGACMFIRAELYHKAGGLDNDFYAHMEEIDLCWRIKQMGYKVMFYPDAKVYHMGGFIIQYGSPAKVFRNHRNNLIMLLKNLPPYQALWKIPLRYLLDLAALFKMYAAGEFKASVGINQAHWQFVRHLGKWLKKRKAVRKLVQNPNHFGIYPKAVIVDYFLKGKKKFSDLKWPK